MLVGVRGKALQRHSPDMNLRLPSGTAAGQSKDFNDYHEDGLLLGLRRPCLNVASCMGDGATGRIARKRYVEDDVVAAIGIATLCHFRAFIHSTQASEHRATNPLSTYLEVKVACPYDTLSMMSSNVVLPVPVGANLGRVHTS